MAKKKKKSEGKKAKEGKRKLPKEIAGIKVPRELRDAGGKLLAAVRQPLVMDVAAAALMAAAAGLREGRADAPAGGGDAKPGKPAKPGGELGMILAATALEGARRLSNAAARQHSEGQNSQNRGNGAGGPGKS